MDVEAVGRVDADGNMRCVVHPKYMGEKKPRVTCERCWQMFFGIKDECVNCGCFANECED